MATIGRSLSNETMARSLNDLTMSVQRLPSDYQDLSMISQWSSSDIHTRHGLRKVLTQFKTISLVQNNCQGKWFLNDCSMNTQGALNDLIDLLMISQRSFNIRQICPTQRRHGWELKERTRISQRNGFCIAFEKSLRDRAYFWSLNGRPTIAVLCKGVPKVLY